MRTFRYMIMAVLAIGVLSTGGHLMTGSTFTDTQSVASNTFVTGTLDISGSATSTLITFNNMSPGDKVTNPSTVNNNGSLELRYAVKSTTTENTLAAQLDMIIKTGVTACTNAGFYTDGTVLYGVGDLGSSTGINLIGNPAQGAHSGDRILAASSSEVLCFQVSLPSSTSDAFQGLTTTATLDLIAEQTTNN